MQNKISLLEISNMCFRYRQTGTLLRAWKLTCKRYTLGEVNRSSIKHGKKNDTFILSIFRQFKITNILPSVLRMPKLTGTWFYYCSQAYLGPCEASVMTNKMVKHTQTIKGLRF